MGIRKVIASLAGLSGCVSVAYGMYASYASTGNLANLPFIYGGAAVALISAAVARAWLIFPLLFGALGVGLLIAGLENHVKATSGPIIGGIFTGGSILALALMLLKERMDKKWDAEFDRQLTLMREKGAAETERLMQTGIPVVATIVWLHDTGGIDINHDPLVELRVRIEPTNGMPAYEGEKTVVMSRVQPFLTGQRLLAVTDPQDTSTFLLLTDISDPSKLPPHLSELFHLVKTPPAGDLTAQLAKLDDLHRSGALSDQEFAAAKARLLGH